MRYDFSRPVKILDEDLPQVRAWLKTWRGRWSGVHLLEKRCPVCRSYLIIRPASGWRYDPDLKRHVHSCGDEVLCPYCRECLVAHPFMPENDNPPAVVTPVIPGWIRCPHCGWRFPLVYPYWTGSHHHRCGQRLILRDPESATGADPELGQPHPGEGR